MVLFGLIAGAIFLFAFLPGRNSENSPWAVAADAGMPDSVWTLFSVTPRMLLAVAVLVPPLVLAPTGRLLVPGFPKSFRRLLLLASAASVVGFALGLPLVFGTWSSILINTVGFYVPVAAAHVALRAQVLTMGDDPAFTPGFRVRMDAFLLIAALFRVDADDFENYMMFQMLICAFTQYWPEIPDFLFPQLLFGGPGYCLQDQIILIPVAICWILQARRIADLGYRRK